MVNLYYKVYIKKKKHKKIKNVLHKIKTECIIMQEIMETGKQKALYYPKELYYDKNELDSCPYRHPGGEKRAE